jgi:hypothetical protein
MKSVYHYTTADRFQGICKSGEIIPATAGVMPPEKPAVWLSVASEWEHTATKRNTAEQRAATLAEMVQACGCLVRIEIDPAQVKLILPLKLRESLKINKRTMDGLLKAAKDAGANPMDWRAVVDSIPLTAFVRVEAANEIAPIQWVKINGYEHLREFLQSN